MATTPYFLWPAQASSASAASDAMAAFEFSIPEETAALAATTAMDMAPLHAPELHEAVARPRLRRQASSGSGKQQGSGSGGGTPKKPPQRGLGVAELERLRCGGVDPLQDLNVAAATAMLEAAASAAASAQGNSVLLHHQHDLLPAFDAATGARYYSPLLVQPPPAPPAPQGPVRYDQGMAPEQQYFMDRWGRMGGFVPAGNAGAGGLHLQQLQALAPPQEHPSSQNTIWRPASSSPSCLHAGHRCDLCTKTMRALSERGSRVPATAAPAGTTTTMPDYSIYDLAAAMTAARKETTGPEGFSAREAKKEVREIEFFPTSTANNHADESEFAKTMRRTPPFSSSSTSVSGGGYAAPLDLSLRL